MLSRMSNTKDSDDVTGYIRLREASDPEFAREFKAEKERLQRLAGVPKDRPTEAVAKLRDIAEWLRAEGEPEIADSVDEAADDIISMYPELGWKES